MKKIVIIGPESTGKSTLSQQLANHYQTRWCPEYAREYLYTHGTTYTYDDLLTIAKGQVALEDDYVRKVNGEWSMVNSQWLMGNDGKVNGEWSMVNIEKLVADQHSTPNILPTINSSDQRSTTNNQPSDQRSTTNNQPSCPILFLDTNMYVMKVWCEFVYGKCHDYITEQIAERKYDLYLLCDIDLPWVQDELREYPDLESRAILYNIYKEILVNQPVPWAQIHGNYQQRFDLAVAAVDQLTSNA